METKPILFSTPMVQAILEGRKTQTRRIIKPQPDARGLRTTNVLFEDYHGKEIKPKYQIGDILYVKEMHYMYGRWVKNGYTKTGKQAYEFVRDNQFREIRYFDNPPEKIEKNSFRGTGWYKRNSLFMSLSSARIFLEVTNVGVEKVQNISEGDAVEEGLKLIQMSEYYFPYYDYLTNEYECILPSESFQSLWIKINGQKSWDDNPWVFVYEFKRIEQPKNFLS